jgi:broad specificity phosphatase PhoE
MPQQPAADASNGGDADRRTVVHLLRHGQVENPTGVVYGRLPGFHLSPLGSQMANKLAEYLSGFDIVALRSSPLERAEETAAPVAAALGLSIETDRRVTEGENYLEGNRFDATSNSAFRNPRNWPMFRNPWRPSWGEPYTEIAERMRAAMHETAARADGRDAVIVSHQLPIWIARLDAEGRRFPHDPRKRECSLASLTSFTYMGGRVTAVTYSEPAAELLPTSKSKKFTAGA